MSSISLRGSDTSHIGSHLSLRLACPMCFDLLCVKYMNKWNLMTQMPLGCSNLMQFAVQDREVLALRTFESIFLDQH